MGSALRREFLNIEGKLYEVKRVLREDSNPIVESWKAFLNCDKAFRRDGFLYLVQEIEEAVIEIHAEDVDNDITNR